MTTIDTVTPQLEEVLSRQADVVLRYFTLFNLGKHRQVANLFAAEGILYPPFEPAVVGIEKIANYLSREAEGMVVSLLGADTHPVENNRLQIDVRGSVTALVFKVNVVWCFVVTAGGQIESVKVDLMATLEELLRLRPAA